MYPSSCHFETSTRKFFEQKLSAKFFYFQFLQFLANGLPT